MKPVRQQRAGRGYLDAVLRDAARPYAFRGGLLRLLNAGAGASMRAAHAYGSLPFNLKYLQHPAYGYDGEWAGHFIAAPIPGAENPGHRSLIPELSPPLPMSIDGGHSQAAPDSRIDGDRKTGSAQPDSPLPQAGEALPGRQPHESARQSREPVSSDHLRQGPPPLVTSRSIDNLQSNIRPASAVSETEYDNSVVDNPDSKRGQDKAAGHNVNHNHLLRRLARQLEEHNFGGRADSGRQSVSHGPQSEIASPGAEQVPVPFFSRQNRLGFPGRVETGGATHRPAATHTKTDLELRERDETQPGFMGQMPLQEQLRLVRNLKRQVTGAQRPETEETYAREPVKAKKKPSAPAAKKTIPVVRQTIVRRVAAPAFWERSYLAHAALRIYK